MIVAIIGKCHLRHACSFIFKWADTLSRKKKKLSGITPIVYTYTQKSYSQAPLTVKIKNKIISVMIIGLMRLKNRKKIPPGIWIWDLWNSRQGPYNRTTMYMVSGHHSNTSSLISPNQRCQSKFYRCKVINFSHSTCSYKDFPLKWSIIPHAFYLFFFYLACNFAWHPWIHH